MVLSFIERPSLNFDLREVCVPIDMLIFHYTGMMNAEGALKRMCDSRVKVSAHYMIDEKGLIYRLVDENKRAWHAGVSLWRGNSNINSRSIGIEVANPGHELGYKNFSFAQMEAVVGLATDILSRHPILARNVVGHSDVAPTRKLDPGELFNWKQLAGEGIGLWPKETKVSHIEQPIILGQLANIGYDIRDIKAAVSAFQRHFRPKEVTGAIDFETAGRISSLTQKINS